MSSKIIPFTRMGSLNPLLRFLRDIGSPYERFLEAAKIPVDFVGKIDQPVPLLSSYRLFEIVAEKEAGEYIGLIAADYAQLADLGSYGSRLLQSKTVYDYLMTGINLFNTQTTGEKFWLQDAGDSVCLYHATFPHVLKQQKLTALFSLGITISNLRQTFGSNWSPEKIGLPVLPSQRVAGDSLADTEIIQTAGYGYLCFSKKLLFKPFTLLVNQSSSLDEVANVEPEKLETELIGSATKLIQMMLPHGYPDINQVAECAGVSRRTLQRMLQELNISYTKLVEDTRIKLACEWLQCSDRHIIVIAQQLAYNDSSNFTRAFRRNTGLSPSAYRSFFR